MAEDVKFQLHLIDQMSRPAGDAAKALGKLEREMRSTEKALKRLSEAERRYGKKGVQKMLGARDQQLRQMAAQKKWLRERERWERRRLAMERKSLIGQRGSISSLKSMAVAYGAVRIAQAGFGAGLRFIESVVGKADFLQRMNMSFSQLLGSQEKGAQAMEISRNMANEFGLSVTDVSERMRGFIAQQFTLGEATTWNKLLADMRVIGVEGERAQRVMMALTQIRSKGKLQAEELLQLAEAGVSLKLVKQELQSLLGVDARGLEKLQLKGKVSGETGLTAIQRAIMGQLKTSEPGKLGKQFAEDTLTGAFSTFRNSADNFVTAIASASSPAFAKLSKSIRDIAKAFTSERAIEAFAKGFGSMGDMLERITPSAVENFAATLEGAGRFFDKVTTLGPAFVEGFFSKLDLGPLSDIFTGEDSEKAINAAKVFGETVGDKFNKAADAAVKLAGAIDKVASVLGFLSDAHTIGSELATGGVIFSDHDKMLMSGMRMVNGIIEGVGLQAPFLKEKMAALAAESQGAFDAENQAHSPARAYFTSGRNITAGVAMGIQQGIPDVLRATGAMASSAQATAGMSTGLRGSSRQASGGGGMTVNQTFAPQMRNNVDISEARDPRETAQAILEQNLEGIMSAMAKAKPAFGVSFNGASIA